MDSKTHRVKANLTDGSSFKVGAFRQADAARGAARRMLSASTAALRAQNGAAAVVSVTVVSPEGDQQVFAAE